MLDEVNFREIGINFGFYGLQSCDAGLVSRVNNLLVPFGHQGFSRLGTVFVIAPRNIIGHADIIGRVVAGVGEEVDGECGHASLGVRSWAWVGLLQSRADFLFVQSAYRRSQYVM